MEFKDSDFEKLMFNVFIVDDKEPILRKFPVLRNYPEYKLKTHYKTEANKKGRKKKTEDEEGLVPIEIDFNKIFRYIVYMYDMNSPFRIMENIITRKVEAAKLAGFEIGGRMEFPEHIEKMLQGRIININKMIIRYVRMQKNTKFAKLVIFEEAYYNELEKLKNKEDEERTSIVIDSVNKLDAEIQNLSNDILGHDNNKFLMKELYEQIEYEELGLRPEEIAQKIRDGEEVLGYTPYKYEEE